jgi:AmiR/NasT family two-component response regulator
MMSEQAEQQCKEVMDSGVGGIIAKPVKAVELQQILIRYLKTA